MAKWLKRLFPKKVAAEQETPPVSGNRIDPERLRRTGHPEPMIDAVVAMEKSGVLDYEPQKNRYTEMTDALVRGKRIPREEGAEEQVRIDRLRDKKDKELGRYTY